MNSGTAVPPCSRLNKLMPWMVWGVASLFVTFQMLLQTSPSVMIEDLQQAFEINAFGVSLLSSSFFYTYVLFQIPAGMLIDRVQPRYCIMVCLIGIAAVTIMFASAHTLNVARVGRILQGAFSAPSIVPALYLAAVWFPSRRFALLAGLTEMIGMSGSAIGQLLLAPSSGYFGWRGTLIGCAMAGLVLAVFTWFIVRNKTAEDAIDVNEVVVETPPPHETHIFRNLLTVISYPQAWINGLFSGLLFSVTAAFGAFWCIPYLIQTYGYSLNKAAAASSMVLFGSAFGAPALGALSDRFGLRKLPMIISTALVLALMLIVLYVPMSNLLLIFAMLFLLGFFSSAYVLPFAVMRDIMPSHVRGTAMGYTNLMSILIGAPLLQPLIGWILNSQSPDAIGVVAYQHALTVLPVCLGIGFVLAFCVQETYCGRKAAAKALHPSSLPASESAGYHYAEP